MPYDKSKIKLGSGFVKLFDAGKSIVPTTSKKMAANKVK